MKRKAFTLVEMLVTIFILVIMLGVATVSISTGKGSSTVAAQAEEIIGLVDELKSFAYGPERERATHYVLIIETTSTTPVAYCNKGLSSNVNTLSKNQYMICATSDKDLNYGFGVLNNGLSRVRAGSLSRDLNIIQTGFTAGSSPWPPNAPIVINIRAYDGQTGYRLKYCELDPSFCGSPSMRLELAGMSENLTFNSILGTLQ